MRTGSTHSLFGLSALMLQGIAAKGWRDQAGYSCPSNIKNDCTADERNGFDWSDLAEGAFDSYKNYNFQGWSCASKFGKRNLEGRKFNGKCIETDLSNSGFSNEISHDKSFSIGELDISVEEEADIEFHYGMEDSSTCKQTTKCGIDGTTVINDQCGGAKTVKAKLPSSSDKKSCKLGVHKVKFECGTTTTSVPVPTTTIPTVVSPTQVEISTTSEAKPTGITSLAGITTTVPSETYTIPSNCTGKTCTMPAGCTSATASIPTVEACTIPTGCTSETCTMPAGCTSATATIPTVEACTIPTGCTGETCTLPAGCISTTATIPTVEACTIPTDCTGETCTMPAGCTSATASTPTVEACTIPTDCIGKTCTMPAGCLPSTTASVPASETCTVPVDCTGNDCAMPAGCSMTPTGSVAVTTSTAAAPTSTAPSVTCTIPSDCTGETCTMPAGCPETTSVPAGETIYAGASTTSKIKPTDTTSSVKATTTTPSETCTIPSDCTGKTCTMPAGCPSSTTASVPASETCTVPADCTGKYCTMPVGCTATTNTVGTAPVAGTSNVSATTTTAPTPVTSAPGVTSSIVASSGTLNAAPTPPSPTTAVIPEVTTPATECPDTLPRCLKTWIFVTSCTDTADPTCFCPEEEFVNKVVGCLSAWSADDNEFASSVEYFLGLCSPYIDENPAIVTAIPSTITLPAPFSNVPAVTITQAVTAVVPCELTTITSGSASGVVVSVTTSTVTQTLTIPQVSLIVTATDATLVYPISEIPAAPTTSAPAIVTTIPTGVPALTTAPGSTAPESTTAPCVTTTPSVPTTLVTYPVGSGTNATSSTANSSLPVSTIVPTFQGSASGIVPATIVAIVGAFAVVLLQL